MVNDGVDRTCLEGAHNLPYAIPNMRCDLHLADAKISTLWWRSVRHTHNGFATDVFFDELATAAGQDPVALRRRLLRVHPRHLSVLDPTLEKAGKPPREARRGRGVTVHASFQNFVAQVADITLADDGRFHLDRVVCAVDCGLAINPDIVRAQMEGGIGYALSAVLREEVRIENGAAVPSNFDTYRRLRSDEMPRVEVQYCSVRRSAHGRRRTGRSAARARRGECITSGHRHRGSSFTDRRKHPRLNTPPFSFAIAAIEILHRFDPSGAGELFRFPDRRWAAGPCGVLPRKLFFRPRFCWRPRVVIRACRSTLLARAAGAVVRWA